jgi:hypothetical protein
MSSKPEADPGFVDGGGGWQMNFFSDLGTLTGNTLTKSKNTTEAERIQVFLN